jgi:hypothetical protein
LKNPDVLVRINREGRVESIEFVHTTGCPDADDRLRECLSQWVFTPAKCDGRPIAVERGIFIPLDGNSRSSTDMGSCQPMNATESPSP